MALNPEEIENMDSETMAIRAEAALREQQSQLAKEDLSDMVVYLCHDSIFYRNFRLLNMPPSRRISARDRSRKRIRSKRNTRSSSSNLREILLTVNSGILSEILLSHVSTLHSNVLQRFETQVQNFPGLCGLLDPGCF